MKKLVALSLLAAVAALALASMAFAKAGVEKAEYGADLASFNGPGANGEAELKLENGLLEAEIESEGSRRTCPISSTFTGSSRP